MEGRHMLLCCVCCLYINMLLLYYIHYKKKKTSNTDKILFINKMLSPMEKIMFNLLTSLIHR